MRAIAAREFFGARPRFSFYARLERSNTMKFGLKLSVRVLMFGCLLIGSMALAQDSSSQQPAPDNTKMNKGDADSSQPTADQQKDNQSDRQVTRQIRQSIMKDKSLSMYAHNVKIISQNGMVTLKGPVRSDEEKQAIEQKAADIVGKDKVTSQLAVKPQQ
jgi:hyperosmotically inducible periplasmic protein